MPSVKVTKHFTYRGSTQKWSNRWHFTNDSPTTDGRWDQFFDNIVAAEKLIYGSGIMIESVVGYDAGSDLPRRSKTYTQAGTATFSSGSVPPGDVAGLVRFGTDQRSVKNHPIYLFKYFHQPIVKAPPDQDELVAAQKTLYETYADAWLGGISDGVLNHRYAGPRGAVAQDRTAEVYVTHRDFVR